MNVKIRPGELSGTVAAPPSKSDAHRKLICAALSGQPTNVLLQGNSRDIAATSDCLRALGAQIKMTESCYAVGPIRPTARKKHLHCAESGSTLRFLLPVAAAFGQHCAFTGEGRLPERPISLLVAQMQAHGVRFDRETLPFSIEGRLESGTYALPGDVSSQYVTGLLFALPLLEGDSQIVLQSRLESKGYVDMTLDMLRQFGIRIEETARGYRVFGRQAYTSPGSVAVEGDWSNAAFFLAAGALKGRVRCTGLSQSSLQGDRAIVQLLQNFGANVEQDRGQVCVKSSVLAGQEIDVSDIPDLLPILAVCASVAKGRTSLHNAARLRLKESDRLKSTSRMLRALGAGVQERADALLIEGRQILRGGTVDAAGDHRIAMAAAIASTLCQRDVVICGAQAVEKSYPDFFWQFTALGGRVHVI